MVKKTVAKKTTALKIKPIGIRRGATAKKWEAIKPAPKIAIAREAEALENPLDRRFENERLLSEMSYFFSIFYGTMTIARDIGEHGLAHCISAQSALKSLAAARNGVLIEGATRIEMKEMFWKQVSRAQALYGIAKQYAKVSVYKNEEAVAIARYIEGAWQELKEKEMEYGITDPKLSGICADLEEYPPYQTERFALRMKSLCAKWGITTGGA